MKRILSVICMALLAGGMIFTSCSKNFTITVQSNNDAWGTVTGGGTFADQATTVLTATPNAGYEFVQWQDGVKQNPRTVSVTEDATYIAYFQAAAPGVKVAFKSENWDASVISAAYSTSLNFWDVYSMKEENSFPVADVAMNKQTTGSTTASADGETGALSSDDFQWVEYYEQYYLTMSDGNNYGDWWAKNATVSVGAFDATSLKVSADVNATMFYAAEAFVDAPDYGFSAVGVDAASTTSMSVKITNIELATAKNIVNKKKGAQSKMTLATR